MGPTSRNVSQNALFCFRQLDTRIKWTHPAKSKHCIFSWLRYSDRFSAVHLSVMKQLLVMDILLLQHVFGGAASASRFRFRISWWVCGHLVFWTRYTARCVHAHMTKKLNAGSAAKTWIFPKVGSPEVWIKLQGSMMTYCSNVYTLLYCFPAVLVCLISLEQYQDETLCWLMMYIIFI